MATTGDGARSYVGPLADVVKRGINTLLGLEKILGVLWASYALEWPGQKKFVAAPFSNYNGQRHSPWPIQDGRESVLPQGLEAGHSVPYYQPETALQVFKQVMQKKPIKT
ncbi:hypothetical protein NOF04DRAFT_1390018 [Fusarium oxysporum II5]|nr:hypothetical protein NOF04DRAFT_1390018 [Fusarium oxysporum II5]